MGEDVARAADPRLRRARERGRPRRSGSRSCSTSSSAPARSSARGCCVVSPTGTGYVNYAAVTALELLARGDCATVAMQYAARPSVLSLDRVDEGRAQARMLLDAMQRAARARSPRRSRPKFVLFGESLGAWTSQDPFVDRGTQGLVDTGIDHAIWIGTPHFSKWKEQVLFDGRAGRRPRHRPACSATSASGTRSTAEERARHPLRDDHAPRRRRRAVRARARDPGAARGSVRRTRARRRCRRACAGCRRTAFFQVLVDMKNSANVVPGKFAAKGHDYRADLLPFFDAALGFDATDGAARRDRRVARDARSCSAASGSTSTAPTGKSLAATVIERALSDLHEQGLDRDDHLARDRADRSRRSSAPAAARASRSRSTCRRAEPAGDAPSAVGYGAAARPWVKKSRFARRCGCRTTSGSNV